MRKDQFRPVKQGIKLKDFEGLKSLLFYAGFDIDSKTHYVYAAQTGTRKAHSGRAHPAGRFVFDELSEQYQLNAVNIDDPALSTDHRTIEETVSNFYARKALGEKKIPAYNFRG